MPHSARGPLNLFFIVMVYLTSGRVEGAQKYLTTFGRVYDAKLPQHAIGVISGDFEGTGRMTLGAYTPRQLLFYGFDSTGEPHRGDNFIFPHPVDRAIAARCDGDRFSDLVLFSENPPVVSVLLGRGEGRFGLAWSTLFEGQFDRISVGDINNDGRADILLYGRHELGCIVFPGRGGGKFGPGEKLFPEYSFSALRVFEANDDGMQEVVGTNWVSQELAIFQNFGNLKFSEPVILPFASEPNLVASARVNDDLNPDLIVASTDDESTLVYLGDGLGNFTRHQTIGMKHPPSVLALGDLNGDGREDLCLLGGEGKSLSVFLNDGAGGFREQVDFAAGISATDMCLVRNGEGRAVDAAILDNGQKAVHLLRSSRSDGILWDPVTYATGAAPERVIAADLNGDGWNDIVAANRSSGSLSLFLNVRGESISGQIALNIGGDPAALSEVRKDDTTSALITVQPASNRIAVTELHFPSFSRSSFSLPSQGGTEVLRSWFDQAQFLHILAFERGVLNQRPAVTEFEQISDERFTEREVTPPAPYPLLAVSYTGRPSARAGGGHLFFASYDTLHRQEAIFESAEGTTRGFDRPMRVLSFDRERPGETILWEADLNRDSMTDIIVYHPAPEASLVVSLGTTDTSFATLTRSRISPVVITEKEHLQITDVNGDGIPDLLIDNDLRKSIELRLGQGNGTFLPGVRLASAEGAGGFALARLTRLDRPSLIVSDALHGRLRIIPLPLPLEGR